VFKDIEILKEISGFIDLMDDCVCDGLLPEPFENQDYYVSYYVDCYDLTKEQALMAYNMVKQIAPIYCENNNIPIGSIKVLGDNQIAISVEKLYLTLNLKTDDCEAIIAQALLAIKGLYPKVFWLYS